MLTDVQRMLNAYNLRFSIEREYLRSALENPRFPSVEDILNLICEFNRILTSGEESGNRMPGKFRESKVVIRNSDHTPPCWSEVRNLMTRLAEDVLRMWNEDRAKLHAYVLWKINWIHPFLDGNGRTSREFSYFLLCVKFGGLLPGDETITSQIQRNKDTHYIALSKADKGDFSLLEKQSRSYLRKQLISAIS